MSSGRKTASTLVHPRVLIHTFLRQLFFGPVCATNYEVWRLPLLGGPVVGFLCFHCGGHRSDLSLDSSACQGMAKKFKKKRKTIFLRCKTKPVKIWVRAESLLCGRWREDREAGWGLFHLSVQTPPELSPFSFPFCDLQLIHGVEFAFLKYRASFLLCPLQMRWGAHKDLRFWYNLRLSDEFIPYKTAYILMTCVKTDISLSKWAEKSP